MITKLGLEGHDSELFSFLDAEQIEQLRAHPSANSALWTFGQTVESAGGLALNSVCSWNCELFPVTMALAFTSKPDVRCEPGSRFHSWRGYTTNDPLVCVEAIVLLRLAANQGLVAQLDGNPWLREPCDWQCERLKFIRDEFSHWQSSFPSEVAWQQTWLNLKADIFRRCMMALDSVPIGLTKEAAA